MAAITRAAPPQTTRGVPYSRCSDYSSWYTTGTRTVNVGPLPTWLATPIDPPSSSANFFVIDNP